MPKCVYCLEVKDRTAFSREHVIQEGFGRFRRALTLQDTVCGVCNQLFGDTIDRELLRESAEGLERYRWGVKKPQEIERFRYRQLTLRAKDAGDFSAARFELRAEPSGNLVAKLVSTVAFRNKADDGFTEYSEAEIVAGTWRANADIDWRTGVRVFGEGDAVERLTKLLAEQGVILSKTRALQLPFASGEEITVQQSFSISEAMYRALAKIAFNYLAYREGSSFVLCPAFDPIRRFVRHAEVPALPVVDTSDDSPYKFPGEAEQRPVVHFVCVAPKHPAHENLLGVVSLFGFLTHTVMLAQDYQGPWPKPHAHLYNPKDLSVHPWRPGVPFTPVGLSPHNGCAD